MKINNTIKENLVKYLNELIKKEKEKVTLVSGHDLGKNDLESLFKIIPSLRNSQLAIVIDKNIFAGVIIKVGSKVIDLSLSGRLKNLKNAIHEIN